MLRERCEIWCAMDVLETKVRPDRCRELLKQLGCHNNKEESLIYSEVDVQLDDDAGSPSSPPRRSAR